MPDPGTHPPRAIDHPYVERVRFSWERRLETALAGVPNKGKGHPDPPSQTLVRLTEASAPRVYRVAREVADTLGFAGRFVLVQTPTLEHLNAQAYCYEDPFTVRLIGPAVSLLDDVALRAIIGHEFGHYLAHSPAATPDSHVMALADKWYGTPMGTACSVSAELTADRFGLLACQDLAAVVRLEVISETLLPADSLGLRKYPRGSSGRAPSPRISPNELASQPSRRRAPNRSKLRRTIAARSKRASRVSNGRSSKTSNGASRSSNGLPRKATNRSRRGVGNAWTG